MLAKENRLRNKKDIERVFKKGKGLRESFLILKFLPNNLKESRLGIIVSQKISKKATCRNKVKRRLRELGRLKLKEMKKRGIDLILIALPNIKTKNFWELKNIINKLFKKAKL